MTASRGRPTLVDNLEWSHEEALRVLLSRAPDEAVRIATGYVSLGGLDLLAKALDDERPLRLLIGAMATQPDRAGVRLAVRDALRGVTEGILAERNRDNFPPARRAAIERVRTLLASDGVQVRRYMPRFLHGKAFIVGGEATLVGSANLTAGGLLENLELGIVDYNEAPNQQATAWFETRWSEETEDAKAELLELLEPPPTDARPYDIFLRALDEWFGSELAAEEPPGPSRLHLARFQEDGFQRARAIADRFGGVLYADGTGLGKTYIGLRFIEELTLGRQGGSALAVVPAQLRQSFWGAAPIRHSIPFHVISHDQLALDAQLGQGGVADHLRVPKDSYRLIVVDEAQAFRNPETRRYKALDKLLGDAPKTVVLMSATPVNNSLWDLYWLVGLFARSEQAFSGPPLRIADLRRFFVRCGANDPDQLSPSRLFRLLSRIAVGRPRSFIERYYGGDTIDGTPVRFPRASYETARYRLEEVYGGLFPVIVDHLGRLRFARYQPARYLTPEAKARLEKTARAEAAREASLAGLLLSGLLKRFESSAAAAALTVETLIRTHNSFLMAWDAGFVAPPEALAEIAAADGELELATVAAELEAVADKRAVADYESQLREHVEADRDVLLQLREEIGEPDMTNDPKIAALRSVFGRIPPDEKVVVFASFADTVIYLAEAIAADETLVEGRTHVNVVGRDTDANQRVRLVARFAPRTAGVPAGDEMGLPSGESEVDLLLSTDVLAEGQNLQQAAYLINFDLTWNPQRMVQRSGRINRLGGRDEIEVHTLAPDDAELERLLRLEARIKAKVRAANAALGMEAQVLDLLPEERIFAEPDPFGTERSGTDASHEAEAAGALRRELRAEAGGGEGIDLEVEEAAGAAAERYRLELKRAQGQGELERIRRIPFGAGCAFRQGAGIPSRGSPGYFFACRVRGERVWRYVTAAEVLRDELPMLQAIEPSRGARSVEHQVDEVVAAWHQAEEDILREWNVEPTDEPTIPAAQQWALEILSKARLPNASERDAAAALRVARRQPVVRALSSVRRQLEAGEHTETEAAQAVVDVVADHGLRAAEPATIVREPIEPLDIEVLCYSAILPMGSG